MKSTVLDVVAGALDWIKRKGECELSCAFPDGLLLS